MCLFYTIFERRKFYVNSLSAIEKLKESGNEKEAQACIEIFRAFCQWYQSQQYFEQIENTFWSASLNLIEKNRLSEKNLIDFFSSKLKKEIKRMDGIERTIDSLLYSYLAIRNSSGNHHMSEEKKECNDAVPKWKRYLKLKQHKKEKEKIQREFNQALINLKSEEIDFVSKKLGEGYDKEELLMIMVPGIGIDKMEAICKLIRQESR